MGPFTEKNAITFSIRYQVLANSFCPWNATEPSQQLSKVSFVGLRYTGSELIHREAGKKRPGRKPGKGAESVKKGQDLKNNLFWCPFPHLVFALGLESLVKDPE